MSVPPMGSARRSPAFIQTYDALTELDQALEATSARAPSTPATALKLLVALQMLTEATRAMNIPMPTVHFVPPESPAYALVGMNALAWKDRIYTSTAFLESVSPREFADVLLHEIGHIHLGHSTLDSMASGADRKDLSAHRRAEERAADVFVSLGDVVLAGSAQMPDLLRRWNHPEGPTHPSSQDRARSIETLTSALETLRAKLGDWLGSER